MLAVAAALAGGTVLVGACSDDATAPEPSAPTAAPPTTAAPPAAAPTTEPDATALTTPVTLRPVAEGLDAPTAMAPRPGQPELWVTEQPGRIRRLRATEAGPAGPDRAPTFELAAEPVLDMTQLTTASGERGLLGIAFKPDGERVFVHHTALDGDVVVAEYQVPPGPDEPVDPATRRVLLTIAHRQFANHNGGQLAIGPDGFLYVAVGDGGGAGDPNDRAQDTSQLLGKILRIDPAGGDGQPYGVPPSNPFAGGGGAPEIYLHGARNPWRFSFDRATGDLWVADVGQNEVEEVTWLPASAGAGLGANLGWNWFEGDRRFRPEGTPPEGLVPPLFTYRHGNDGVCSVTGGYVYRGTAVAGLQGVYLYGDYCVGEVRGLLARDGEVLDEGPLGPDVGPGLVSFGQDADGEIYVLTRAGAVLRVEEA